MSHHPWGQTVEIFGIELPTNRCCCEEQTICLVLYPMTGTKGMNGIVGVDRIPSTNPGAEPPRDARILVQLGHIQCT